MFATKGITVSKIKIIICFCLPLASFRILGMEQVAYEVVKEVVVNAVYEAAREQIIKSSPENGVCQYIGSRIINDPNICSSGRSKVSACSVSRAYNDSFIGKTRNSHNRAQRTHMAQQYAEENGPKAIFLDSHPELREVYDWSETDHVHYPSEAKKRVENLVKLYRKNSPPKLQNPDNFMKWSLEQQKSMTHQSSKKAVKLGNEVDRSANNLFDKKIKYKNDRFRLFDLRGIREQKRQEYLSHMKSHAQLVAKFENAKAEKAHMQSLWQKANKQRETDQATNERILQGIMQQYESEKLQGEMSKTREGKWVERIEAAKSDCDIELGERRSTSIYDFSDIDNDFSVAFQIGAYELDTLPNATALQKVIFGELHDTVRQAEALWKGYRDHKHVPELIEKSVDFVKTGIEYNLANEMEKAIECAEMSSALCDFAGTFCQRFGPRVWKNLCSVGNAILHPIEATKSFFTEKAELVKPVMQWVEICMLFDSGQAEKAEAMLRKWNEETIRPWAEEICKTIQEMNAKDVAGLLGDLAGDALCAYAGATVIRKMPKVVRLCRSKGAKAKEDVKRTLASFRKKATKRAAIPGMTITQKGGLSFVVKLFLSIMVQD